MLIWKHLFYVLALEKFYGSWKWEKMEMELLTINCFEKYKKKSIL